MEDKIREVLSIDNLMAHFPHRRIRPQQRLALESLAEHGSLTLEGPTGFGKSAVGYAFLATLADAGVGPVWYITPNKTLVDQVHQMHPSMTVGYGRREYDCLYYEPEEHLKADEIPCLSLRDCSHRVNIETGATHGEEEGQSDVQRCPYYWAKYKARQSQVVVGTYAFYLFNMFFSKQFEPPAGLVIDEAHEIAEVIRRTLSYNITDDHLKRSITLLKRISAPEEAAQLQLFLDTMKDVLNSKPWIKPTLLEEFELQMFIDILSEINADKLRAQLKAAIAEGEVDVRKERETLKRLEDIIFSLYRYIRSLAYSIPNEHRNALNYVTYAEGTKARNPNGRSEYRLVVKAYYVSPLVKKLMAPVTLAMSGTIGNNELFGIETGIKLPFLSLPGIWPAKNTMVAMPTDTANLLASNRSHGEPAKSLRKIARGCRWFADRGIRTMVVVVSNKEMASFLRMADEEELQAISYNNGATPKEAMNQFKAGNGTTLVGTAANYGQGVDLPGDLAPVIFFLRPGYPNPMDPQTQFEEKRFGSRVWALRQWRVMIQAMQVRGRNVRSAQDRGVTIFVSQSFRKFLYSSLPEWLKPSYEGSMTLEEVREEVAELLK